MKFLIVGLGSIGQRHAKNIYDMKLGDIVAYRTTNKKLRFIDSDIIKKTYNDYEKALEEKPDITLITNPTSLHIPFAIKAAENGSHLLIEKPLSNNLDNIDKLIDITNRNHLKTLIGCNLRFLKCIEYIKYLIDNKALGKIYHIQAIFGKHINTWHPWENYENSYACRKDLGGGIILTGIHEIDYIYWLFGIPLKVIFNKANNLGLPVEDSVDILMTFKDGFTANIHMDYINKKFIRNFIIIGENGTISYDMVSQEVSVSNGDTEIKRIGSNKDFEESYKQELLYLIKCIKEDMKPMNTLKDGKQVLKIALGIGYEN